eukprot:scaffold16295_cov42-Phaeocystis_antarctica.AAC.1
MQQMFYVRSSPCVHAACAASTPRPHRMPSSSTRQSARAFNQPLGFDSSSVTKMGYMFDGAW